MSASERNPPSHLLGWKKGSVEKLMEPFLRQKCVEFDTEAAQCPILTFGDDKNGNHSVCELCPAAQAAGLQPHDLVTAMKVQGSSNPPPSSDSPLFASTRSSLPLVFGRSNLGVKVRETHTESVFNTAHSATALQGSKDFVEVTNLRKEVLVERLTESRGKLQLKVNRYFGPSIVEFGLEFRQQEIFLDYLAQLCTEEDFKRFGQPGYQSALDSKELALKKWFMQQVGEIPDDAKTTTAWTTKLRPFLQEFGLYVPQADEQSPGHVRDAARLQEFGLLARPPPAQVARFQLCRHFSNSGSCHRGADCSFAHSQQEVRQWPAPPPMSSRPSAKSSKCHPLIAICCCMLGKGTQTDRRKGDLLTAWLWRHLE